MWNKKGGFMTKTRKNPHKAFRNREFDIQELLLSFDKYLDHMKGLASRTRKLYCDYIQSFLKTYFKKEQISLINLQRKKIIDFLISYKEKGSDHRAQAMSYSLRSFFKFLYQTRAIQIDLVECIPWIKERKKTIFPTFLNCNELEKILESCNRNDPVGLRDYAILMLMIQFGLRASEVCSLTLDDLNWDKSEINIRGKGTVSRFPLYQELGDAIAAYLLHGRPECYTKALFITAHKPYRSFQTSSAITGVLKAALKRTKLNPSHKGTHLLRHSFAMELLRKGATLYEISTALRHKSISTTAIYAKVDFEELSIIAIPWPIQKNNGG
jgi:integrase/recombinase XerD